MAETLPEYIARYQKGLVDKKEASLSPRPTGISGIYTSRGDQGFDEAKSYPWLDDFVNVVEKIMAIVSDPRTHLKAEKQVKLADKAVRIDNEDVRMTLRVPKFWKQQNNRMLPEYIYTSVFETEYAIYENRFVVTLVDKMMTFISHAISELFAQIRFLIEYVYDNEIDMVDLGHIQKKAGAITFDPEDKISKKDQVAAMHLLTTPDSPVISTLMKLLDMRRELGHALSTPFYKEVKKARPLSDSDIHITNMLAGDRKYAPCFRFYLQLQSYQSNENKKEELLRNGYVNYVINELLNAYRRLGFKVSNGQKMPIDKKGRIDLSKVKLHKDGIEASFVRDGDIHFITNYKVDFPNMRKESSMPRKHFARVSIDILPGLSKDYQDADEFNTEINHLLFHRLTPEQDFENAFVITSEPLVRERGAVVCNPYFGKLDANLENMIKSCLTFISADKWTYSRICPVCGFFVGGEGQDGNCYCANCDSVYSFMEIGRGKTNQSTLWIKRLHNPESKAGKEGLGANQIMRTDEDLDGEKVVLRLLEDNDLEELYANTRRAGVLEMIGREHTPTKEGAKILLNNYINDRYRAICKKDDGTFLGVIGFVRKELEGYKRFGQRRVDLWIGEKYWGYGYASDALSTFAKYGFTRLRLDMIWAQAGNFNKAAIKVLAHNGFLFVDDIQDTFHKDIVEADRLQRFVLFNPRPVKHASSSGSPLATPEDIRIPALSDVLVIEPITAEEMQDKRSEQAKKAADTKAKQAEEETRIAEEEARLAKQKSEKEEAERQRRLEKALEESKKKEEAKVKKMAKKEEAPVSFVPFGPGTSDDSQHSIHTVSFDEKLALSSKELQGNYKALSELLLSYPGVTHRVNFGYDGYRYKKQLIATLSIGGVHLRLNTAMDPSAYKDEPKMRVNDDSKSKKYKDVPSYIKVMGEKSLKQAKRLIEDTIKSKK